MGKVIITMPAYRAEATLEKTVAGIPAAVADELILVDDASPDNTAALARSLGISVYVHPRNRGYGGNQKTCYTMALDNGAEIVVMLHPDYQYEPKSVPLLLAPILAGEADMTFGSRFAGLGDPRAGGMPMYRFVGNRITTTIENLVLGSRFSEMHSGMRAYTRSCLLSLPFLGYSEDFGFDSQFMVDAVTTGQRVVEVPIPTRYTKESSSIGVARSLKYVLQSVTHATARSAARGRRGRRYPVTRARALVAGTGPARLRARQARPGRQVDPREVLDIVASFYLPGRRLLALDAEGGTVDVLPEGRWEAAEEEADVGLLADSFEAPADPARAVGALASRVRRGGIAAVYAAAPDPDATAALLRGAGLTMVEWRKLRSGGLRGPATTVVVSRRDG
jgi:hypothetical protein